MKSNCRDLGQVDRLDAEERRDIKNCLAKDRFPLSPNPFNQFICDIENLLAHYQSVEPDGSFRETHNALRRLWILSHHHSLLKQSPDSDEKIAVIRELIEKLPKKAAHYIDRRVAKVASSLFPNGPATTHFRDWARTANRTDLILEPDLKLVDRPRRA
jgi:hypothetical protein